MTLTPERTYGNGGGQRSVSFTQRPDVAVDIRSQSGDLDLVLFDPKYKLDADDERSGIPVKSDVDKMHSYRDAIRDPLGEHLVRFAATLYPGRTQCYGRDSMTAWIALNSTVRFLLKLCALLALMYWGIHTGNSMAEGIVIGALAPGAAIFVWWKLIAPKSASWLTDTGRLLVEMAVFGLSALALAAAGQTLVAISFAVVAVLNASFLLVAPRS